MLNSFGDLWLDKLRKPMGIFILILIGLEYVYVIPTVASSPQLQTAQLVELIMIVFLSGIMLISRLPFLNWSTLGIMLATILFGFELAVWGTRINRSEATAWAMLISMALFLIFACDVIAVRVGQDKKELRTRIEPLMKKYYLTELGAQELIEFMDTAPKDWDDDLKAYFSEEVGFGKSSDGLKRFFVRWLKATRRIP